MGYTWIAVRFVPGTDSSVLREIYRRTELFLIEERRQRARKFDMASTFKARVHRSVVAEKARQLREIGHVAQIDVEVSLPIL